MKRLSLLLTVLAAAAITGCESPRPMVTATPPTPPVRTPEDVANAAAGEFSATLRSRLQASMGADGPMAAIDVCKTEAPRIAEAIQRRHGVRIGRVPVPGRQRNPANQGEPWVQAVLQDFMRRTQAGEPVTTLVHRQTAGMPAGVALRFAKAIDVQPGCLACHGRTIAPPIAETIRRAYPTDTATGFGVGDLRGVLWVEVPVRP